jgi:pantoate--beta-alanine ligase
LTGAPRVARTRTELAAALSELRRGGARVGLVPTMGFLHAGHLALVDHAAGVSDAVVVSIFVNPLQFGPDEDLARYPRDLDRDLSLVASRGAELVFAPPVEVMYPHGEPQVRVTPGRGGERLCGAFRPGHFEGVLTVVARLFGLVRPDVAVFGRKDAQQAALIRQMVQDLELGVDIEVAPLVREADGLALSSRNAYLDPDEREVAPMLFRALAAADRGFRGGETRPGALVSRVHEVLGASGAAPSPVFRPEYVEVVDPVTLETPDVVRPGHLLAAAGWLGGTRLIDNVVLGAADPDPRATE